MTFRWCRITVWFAALVVICAFFWLNQIGLPDFLTRRIVDTLHAHGFELRFARMRLHLANGIVAENVRLGDINITNNPTLSFAQVQLPINFPALLHGKVKIDGIVLRQGKLVWPLSPTNALTVERIQTQLHFQPDDTWRLNRFNAQFSGVRFDLSGEIAHAPALQKFFRGKKSSGSGALQAQLQKASSIAAQIHFEGAPLISLHVKGDARDAGSFVARLNVTAPAVQTPWGGGSQIRVAARLDSAGANSCNSSPVECIAFLQVTNAVALGVPVDFLQTHFYFTNQTWQLPDFEIVQNGARLQIVADENGATGDFQAHLRGQFNPETIRSLLQTNEIHWLEHLKFTGPLALNASASGNADDFSSIRAGGFIAVTNFSVNQTGSEANAVALPVDLLRTHFSLSNEVLRLPDLEIAQDRTHLQIAAVENNSTRQFNAGIRGQFHPATIRPLLTNPMAIREFENVEFREPLTLEANLQGRLDNFDSIGANGFISLTNIAIWRQAIDSGSGNFVYTNRALEFLHPVMHRAGGAQTMTADSVTLNFRDRLIYFTNGFSTTDPEAFINMIGPKAAHIVGPFIQFPSPPAVRVNGQVPLRDINSGSDMETADLRFDVYQPTPYRLKKFYTPAAQGIIRWLGQFLILSNMTGEIYGGQGSGYATFDFHPKQHVADYNFAVDVADVDIHRLATAFERTNKLEGFLSGALTVTSGNTESLMSWNGYGHASLRDGLIWDEPVFGFLSPVLNSIYPGLGNSRATDATATFGLTNGVFSTSSLEIRSTIVRLNYAGTVDLEKRLDARVNGQLLRDVWGVGPIIGTVLWPMSKLFEYHVTGTLEHPKSDPIYVPKALLMPLHPIRTIEGILPGSDVSTNSPPSPGQQ